MTPAYRFAIFVQIATVAIAFGTWQESFIAGSFAFTAGLLIDTWLMR